MLPLRKLQTVARLLGRGDVRALGRLMRVRAVSETTSYGLRRDLSRPHVPPPAKISVRVRPYEAGDERILLAPPPGASRPVLEELHERARMLTAGPPTCWVAVAESGEPCFMQWLYSAEHNAALHALFAGLYPVLASDAALLEGAYTVDRYRGMGIMAHAMALVADRATELGARSVWTYVPADNVASLKGCARAGFVPERLRVERWRAFRRSVAHATMSPDLAGRVSRALGS
jgi:RimJ/RimL family protein N-acetyltransferase